MCDLSEVGNQWRFALYPGCIVTSIKMGSYFDSVPKERGTNNLVI